MLNPQLQVKSNTQVGAFAQLSGPAGTREVQPGFRELLDYFLRLGELSAAASQRQALLAGPASPLLSAPLQLDIQIQGFERMQNQQEVQIQLLRTAQGLTLRVSSGSAVGAPFGHASTASVGQILWDYRADLSQAEDAEATRQMLKSLLQTAESVLEYLLALERLRAFEMSIAERRSQEKAQAKRDAEAAKAALERELEQRRIQTEFNAKDWLKRRRSHEDKQLVQLAKQVQHRTQQFISSAEKQVTAPDLEPSQLSGLLRECEQLRLDLRDALAVEVRTTSAGLS